jgi:hypothetical protein
MIPLFWTALALDAVLLAVLLVLSLAGSGHSDGGREMALLFYIIVPALIFGLSFYYDVRDRKLYEAQRRQTIFHCIRCDKLYGVRAGTDSCACPRCGFKNGRLTF